MWAKLYVQIALEGEFMAKTRLYLLLTLSRAGFKEFGDVDLGTYTLGIIACHKNRSGSLAKKETLPRTRRCNKLHSTIYAVLLSEFASRGFGYDISCVGRETPHCERQVPFGATPRLRGSDSLEGRRHLALLERFRFSTPGSFRLVGGARREGS